MRSFIPILFLLALAAGGIAPGRGLAQDRVSVTPEVARHAGLAARLGLYRPPATRVLAPVLSRRAASRPQARIKAWVFFTDKGIGTPGSYLAAVHRTRVDLSPIAVGRRRALGPDLGVDFRDLPVRSAYVDAVRASGLRVRRVSRWLNAVSVEGTAAALRDLSGEAYVHEIRPLLVRRGPRPEPEPGLSPPPVTRALSESVSDSLEQWFYGPSYAQLDQIEVLDLHRRGYSGAGVRVMMIDTGFLGTHPAFARAAVVAEWDFVNDDPITANEPEDPVEQQHNHGTGAWGVLGGYDPSNLIGPAFAAEFVLAKTEDLPQEVHAEEDNYVAALEWADTLGVAVTSASLGYWTFDDSTGYGPEDMDGDTGVITVAVDIAVAKGMACVNSAGNAGPGITSIGTPADADSVISVGAVNDAGTIESFSSRGPTADGRIKPEVVARGRDTWWAQAWTLGYGPASGTSLAAPLVGGVAALLKEAHPGWTGAEIREALIGTADQAGTPDNNRGYGLVQGLSALTFAGAAPQPARLSRPFALLVPGPAASVATTQPTLVWSRSRVDSSQAPATYAVIVADNPSFDPADTIAAGTDTSHTVAAPLVSGQSYWWRVEATRDGWVRRSVNEHTFSVTPSVGAPDPGSGGSLRTRLIAATPNPMRSRTTILVSAPAGSRTAVDVVSVDGRRVRRLPVTGAGAGVEAPVVWDGRDEAGRPAPAGVYFVRLQDGDRREVRKLVRLP